MAATVDEISGGRLVLGLGAGDSPSEHRAFGYATDHWVGRFEEALTIIRALLRDGSCDFAGTYYEVHECRLRPPAPRAGGPPILIAAQGTGRRMLRLTAQHADLWNAFLVYARSLPDALPPLQAIVDAACAAHGRDPATLARTAGVRVALLGEHVPVGTPISGSAEAIAETLRGFAGAGAAAVQLLLTPNTLAGLEAFALVLEHLDRG
jgi:alkanesulfonate monooxygenase SsuD/methylene tetrahydromethanopterin reductase-like flavin-dependent oxidoreductase (luciferase family)